MLDKTVAFVLKHTDFKTLGGSRTDAMVSANHSAFELFLTHPIPGNFLEEFNRYLPPDIRALNIEEVDKTFNIIQTPKLKEYVYLFSFGEKVHPFSASVISLFTHNLDIGLMKQGAALFLGKHNFKKYSTKPTKNTQFDREILVSEIKENDLFTANFFPEISYAYHIHSKGFMRNQVRLMMGQLLLLGKGETTLPQLQETLDNPDNIPLDYIAPASGLILNKIKYQTF
ncbi:MAG: tRNA pseudouridine(38-40) synthase TruA [Flavobacteriales bacterium]|nr:tRNA pseudouridine(38-40) synthase TruA [Flavobacteriales bacterium]